MIFKSCFFSSLKISIPFSIPGPLKESIEDLLALSKEALKTN